MAVEQVPMFRVLCDRCGVSAQEDGEYYAWADADSALVEADDSGWLFKDGKHWCPDCVIWDEEADEPAPNPEPLESETTVGAAS